MLLSSRRLTGAVLVLLAVGAGGLGLYLHGFRAKNQNDNSVLGRHHKGDAANDDAAVEVLNALAGKALQAAGGAQLQAVKACTFAEKFRGKPALYRRYVEFPNRIRLDTEIEANSKKSESSFVIDGDKGWSVSDGRIEELSATQVSNLRESALWTYLAVIGPTLVSAPECTPTDPPEITIEGRAAIGARLPEKDYGNARLYFDKETGRLLKVEKDYSRQDGKHGTTELILKDYRMVAGIMVPHTKIFQDGGRVLGESDVVECKFFDKLDPKRFERPNQPQFVTTFRTIKSEAEARQKSLSAALKNESGTSVTVAERTGASQRSAQESSKVIPAAADKVMAAVREHAADPAAVEALVWVANSGYATDAGMEAAQLLIRHHLVNKQTIDLAFSRRRGPAKWTEPMLRAQLAAANLPEAERPRVLFALAQVKQSYSELAGRLATMSDEQLARMEGYYGKEALAAIRAFDVPRAEAEAIQLYTELTTKHGSEKLVGGYTFGEIAKVDIDEIQNLAIGKTALEIRAEDADGMEFKLSDYRGKVVLLSFWGSWCGPCMQMVPHEREIVERLKNKPFALIGVNSDRDRTKLRSTMSSAHIDWRSFWCGEDGSGGPIPKAWHVTVWPTTYVLDRNGVIRAKQLKGTDLDRVIDKLVAEAETVK